MALKSEYEHDVHNPVSRQLLKANLHIIKEGDKLRKA